MIENYQDLPPKLYAGDIDECFEFLDARRAADSNSADYWHWRAVTHLRAQQFEKALDICFYLTRESDVFGYQIHCLADACSHLGLKETALTAIDYFGKKPTTQAIGAFLWRVYGWHYLGEDQRVLDLNADGVDEHSVYVLGHHQARSQMRLQGIEHGVAAMHRWWSSPEARRVLFPHLNLDGCLVLQDDFARVVALGDDPAHRAVRAPSHRDHDGTNAGLRHQHDRIEHARFDVDGMHHVIALGLEYLLYRCHA